VQIIEEKNKNIEKLAGAFKNSSKGTLSS